jgi:hypothetical protein
MPLSRPPHRDLSQETRPDGCRIPDKPSIVIESIMKNYSIASIPGDGIGNATLAPPFTSTASELEQMIEAMLKVIRANAGNA